MKPGSALLIVLVLMAAGCSKSHEDEGGLGQQLGEAISDTDALREAQAAANQVVRNATDCDAVKANIEEVNRKLDEVEGRIQTATGRTTFEALREQVRRIAESCGVL